MPGVTPVQQRERQGTYVRTALLRGRTDVATLTVNDLLRGRLVVLRLAMRQALVDSATDLVALLLGPRLLRIRLDGVLDARCERKAI